MRVGVAPADDGAGAAQPGLGRGLGDDSATRCPLELDDHPVLPAHAVASEGEVGQPGELYDDQDEGSETESAQRPRAASSTAPGIQGSEAGSG